MKRALCFFVLFLLNVISARAYEVKLSVVMGAPMPDLSFDGLADPADYAALGLSQTSGGFRLSDVPGEVLVLEFFNKFCMHCQRQAPVLQSFYDAALSGELKGKVRVLTLGVGNRMRELKEFRTQFHLSYPIAADPDFDRFIEMGDPGGTPLTLLLVRREGRWVLAGSHLGLQGDTELMAGVRVLLEGKGGTQGLESLSAHRAGTKSPEPEINAPERAKALLAAVLGKDVAVDEVELSAGVKVYRALGADGLPSGLFARVARREPVCDVCHAIRFVFAFDRAGTVKGFEPIYLTKYGNEELNGEDVNKLRARLSGRSMKTLSFEPEVDAVTSATMTSSLVFDEVRRSVALLDALEKK